MIWAPRSRDTGVEAFFKVTLKAIWGSNTQPADDGRARRGLREKFTGPSLEVGNLTSAHSNMPHITTAGNSGGDGPPEKGKWVCRQWQSLLQRLRSTLWLTSLLPLKLTLYSIWIAKDRKKNSRENGTPENNKISSESKGEKQQWRRLRREIREQKTKARSVETLRSKEGGPKGRQEHLIHFLVSSDGAGGWTSWGKWKHFHSGKPHKRCLPITYLQLPGIARSHFTPSFPALPTDGIVRKSLKKNMPPPTTSGKLSTSGVIPKPPWGHEGFHPQDTMSLRPPGEYAPLLYTRLDWAALVLKEEKEEREKNTGNLCIGGWGGRVGGVFQKLF